MPKCPECGANLREGAKYCDNCSQELTQSQKRKKYEKEEKSILVKEKSTLIAISAVIIVVLLLAGVIWYVESSGTVRVVEVDYRVDTSYREYEEVTVLAILQNTYRRRQTVELRFTLEMVDGTEHTRSRIVEIGGDIQRSFSHTFEISDVDDIEHYGAEIINY